MTNLMWFIIGVLVGSIGVYIAVRSEDEIIYEEYYSNAGKRCYKIYRTENGVDDRGKKKKYEIYLGEVSEED